MNEPVSVGRIILPDGTILPDASSLILPKPAALSMPFQPGAALERMVEEIRSNITIHADAGFAPNPDAVNVFRTIVESVQRLFDDIVQGIRPAIDALVRWLKKVYPYIKPYLPRPKCQPRRRSTRRLQVQQKRKQLGLDVNGRHWAYTGWKRRDILAEAERIGGFCS